MSRVEKGQEKMLYTNNSDNDVGKDVGVPLVAIYKLQLNDLIKKNEKP